MYSSNEHSYHLKLVHSVYFCKLFPKLKFFCWNISPYSGFLFPFSILEIKANSGSFPNQACHTKAEYEEYGASICRTNPVFKGMY